MGKFGWFVAGGVIGAGVALALTPKTGDETRAAVADAVTGAWDATKDVAIGATPVSDIYENAKAQVQEAAQSAVAKGQEVADDLTSKVQEAADNVSGAAKSDELREKIEAARQRIAAQVVRNAEESQAAPEPIQAEVEDVVETQPEQAEVE